MPETRNAGNIPTFNKNHNFLKTFFPPTINEWNILDSKLRNSESLGIFKNINFEFIDPNQAIFITATIKRGLTTTPPRVKPLK